MDLLNRSVFCGAALVSELLSREELDAMLRAAATAADRPLEQLDDQQIAAATLQLGLLNRWQVEQLKVGRTKFTLGPYKIIDSIGRGGMGHVFKAVHSLLGRVEAIKVLPKQKTTPEAIATFRREIRAQAQLDHPNLVRLTYADQDGSTWFFVTEFVPGTDLRRLIRLNGRLSLPDAATAIAQAAQALEYVHQNGLVHRDVKPGNLLVTPDGRVKLTDLGLSGYFSDADVVRRGSEKLVGTADYMAPESIRSPSETSPVSDIYSLGCTLYYAVTGKVPFPGGKTSDKLRRHCEEMPFNPQRLNEDLDEVFLDVLADMMHKNPADRTQTAAEVIERLRPWSGIHLSTIAMKTALNAVQNAEGSLSSKHDSHSDSTQQSIHPSPSLSSELESPSQISQSTDPPSSALRETLPIDESELEFSNVPTLSERVTRHGSQLPLLVILAIASATALLWIVLG